MLNFHNVSFLYKKNYGISKANFSVGNGEFVFLVGSSGAGKTTIFRLINLEFFQKILQKPPEALLNHRNKALYLQQSPAFL